MTKLRHMPGTSLVVLTATAGGLVLPTAAFGQTVTDRTLSDVRAETVGGCTTLTINFNIRVQVLSSFPETGGRELHIRVRPLDEVAAYQLRESLRTPASVPELRSIQFEGDNASGPILSLFFTRDVRFKVEAGAAPQSLVVKLTDTGSGPMCSTPDPATPAMPTPLSTAKTPATEIAVPAGLYAVNVMSKPSALDELTPLQMAAIDSKVAYETTFERDSQQWHRLRVGFFETREQAEASKAKLAAIFPEAWVVKVSTDERLQGVANRVAGKPVVASAGTSLAASDADIAETQRLIGDGEQAIRENNNDRAIQLLTNAASLPDNVNTPRARELLGLTRERKGQMAQARAEYEEYLRRYPNDEGAERVRQRLAALSGGTAASPSPELRAASGNSSSASAWAWGARGSFSQFYFRDQGTTKFVEAVNNGANTEIDNSVNLNQLLTAADVTISGGNDRRQIQLRAAGSYNKNFGTSTTTITQGNTVFRSRPGAGVKALTALYLDYSDSDLHTSVRLGRQTRNSAGVLGRFDGLLVGYQAKPKLRINLAGGFPVLTSRQTYVLKDRYFYGASLDFGNRQSALQTTVYWFDQHARGGFIDRRSVGLEARFLRPRFNAYSIVDYDVKYGRLNLGLMTLNYNFPDNSNISLTADYRHSPLLTTSNALIGQANPLTLTPITELRGLKPFFTDAQIYGLAKDRTLVAKSFTASYSRPITRKLQTNLDVTVTDTGGTPESGGVPAMLPTGKEYYYGAQIVGSGMLWRDDIYIMSARYSNSQRTRTYTGDFNARIPVSSRFRLSPRVRYGYRTDKFIDSTYKQLQPTLRINYFPMLHSEIELEFGGNFTKQITTIAGSPSRTNESGYVLSAGYRVDF